MSKAKIHPTAIIEDNLKNGEDLATNKHEKETKKIFETTDFTDGHR